MRAGDARREREAVRSPHQEQSGLRRPNDCVLGDQPAPERHQVRVVMNHPPRRFFRGTRDDVEAANPSRGGGNRGDQLTAHHAQQLIDLNAVGHPDLLTTVDVQRKDFVRIRRCDKQTPAVRNRWANVAGDRGGFREPGVSKRPRRFAGAGIDRHHEAGVRTEDDFPRRERQQFRAVAGLHFRGGRDGHVRDPERLARLFVARVGVTGNRLKWPVLGFPREGSIYPTFGTHG